MKASNKKYHKIHIYWSMILILFVFTGFQYGCTQVVETSQLQFRNGLWHKRTSDKPFTGRVVGKYSNGQKQYEKTYKDGKLDGKWTLWHVNKQKLCERNYKEGKLISEKSWDKNGNIMDKNNILIFRSAQAGIRKIERACNHVYLDGVTITKWELAQIKAACVPEYIKEWPTCPGGGSWNFERKKWVAADIGNATIYVTNVFKDVENDM